MRFLKHIAAVIFLVTLFISCERDKDEKSVPNRIVIAYLGGDQTGGNNLTNDLKQKVSAMVKGWNPSIDGRLFVYADPSDELPYLLEITTKKGVAVADTIKIYSDDTNSADPGIYGNIINDIVGNYEALSYGLIVFSHGTGWLPSTETGTAVGLPGLKSIIMDGNDWMEITDFANATPDGLFDFIIFEACFMGSVEVVYELKDKTDYILVSSAEILAPGFEDLYGHAIRYLFDRTANINAFAEAAFDYWNSMSGDYRSATFSVIRTDKLEDLAQWIKNNGGVIAEGEVNIGAIQQFGRAVNNFYGYFFDLADTYNALPGNNGAAELETLIGQCVVYKNATPSFMPNYGGFQINKHCGLTTYIMQNRNAAYHNFWQGLKWYNAINTE